DWHKGRAVDWIRARVARAHAPSVTAIYLGDDRTDEDAFASLGQNDLAIGVGARPHSHLIDWRLAGPASAGRFFAHLARLRVGGFGGSDLVSCRACRDRAVLLILVSEKRGPAFFPAPNLWKTPLTHYR